MLLCCSAVALLCPLPAPAFDGGPGQRPDWLRRIVADPLTGREVAPDDWMVAGGDFDAPGAAGGFIARGVTLLSWLPLSTLPGDAEAGADCWGYTSPSGREYAIMCVSNGTGFIEVTDPLHPKKIGFIGGNSSMWHDPQPWKKNRVLPSVLGPRFSCDATVVGGYCYAGSDVAGGVGIQVIDLRRIDEGVVMHVKNWSSGGLLTVQTLCADPVSRRLYACGANIANGGLLCIDVSDPEKPVLAGAWTDQPVHDAFAMTVARGPCAGRPLVFCFAGGPASGRENGLAVLDAADISDPRTLALIGYPGIAFCRQGWAMPDQGFLFVGDEPGPSARPAMRVMDIADPAHPAHVASIPAPGATGADRNLVVAGDLLFQASGTRGLRILDASDPAAPFEFASFDTVPENDDPTDQGAWGVYPFFRSGTIVVSDMQRGLFLLRVDGRADFDRDGRVSPFDGLAFECLYGAGDPSADLSGDGVLDLCDFLKFQDLLPRGGR